MIKKNNIWLIGLVLLFAALCFLGECTNHKPSEPSPNRTKEIIDSLDIERSKQESHKIDSVANYYMQKVDSIKKTKTKLKIAYIEIKKDTTVTDSEKLSLCDQTLEESEKENYLKDKVIELKDSTIAQRDETIEKQSLVIINLGIEKNILYSDNKKLKSNQRHPLWKEITNYAVISSASILAGILLSPYR